MKKKIIFGVLGFLVLAVALAGGKKEEVPPQPLEFSVSVEASDGKPSASGKTNLPDETELMASIYYTSAYYGDSLLGQGKTAVSKGSFSFGPFSIQGDPYAGGEYSFEISSPLWKIQPESVRKKIDSIILPGDYTTGEDHRISYAVTFEVQGSPTRQDLEERARTEGISLYEELMALKDEPIFIQKGFGPGNARGHEWMNKAERVRASFDKMQIPIGLALVPAYLMQVGLDYVYNKQGDSTLALIDEIKEALSIRSKE